MRKTKLVTIELSGRDKGKQFLITEMPASRGEQWAMKALLAMMHNTNLDLPDGWQQAPMMLVAGIGLLKVLASIPFEIADELSTELMACIKPKAMPNLQGKLEEIKIDRILIEDDIEEIATRAVLKSEVFEVHTGFSVADALLKSIASVKEEMWSLMQMSPDQSASSSPPN